MAVSKNFYSVLRLKTLIFSGCASANPHYNDGIDAVITEQAGVIKTSFSYKILEMRTKLTGYKKIYASDAQTLVLNVQKYNAGRRGGFFSVRRQFCVKH